MSVQNFSFLARLEVAEKFVVGWGGVVGWWSRTSLGFSFSQAEQHSLQISWSLGKDGETNFAQRRRRCLIKIKRVVATSKRSCWRRAIVCHEMGHALHYFMSDGQILEGKVNGKEWKKWMVSAIKEGVLKECAKKLKSPSERCIFKQKCIWCTTNDKKVTKYVRKTQI